MRQKFIAVRVVEKFQSLFGERFTGSIEDRGRLATALFVEWILVRDRIGKGGSRMIDRQRNFLICGAPKDIFAA